mmetsp:Transcript_30681/g.91829  ORF Transcript_30681/g.91829 Transcript_30681/m.91829 type:complete len:81 (+) Transcript_30681:151-393(+)
MATSSALQFGLRRTALTSLTTKATAQSSLGSSAVNLIGARRYKSTDAGDVIGIDLGTTNSCVAVMVSWFLCWSPHAKGSG